MDKQKLMIGVVCVVIVLVIIGGVLSSKKPSNLETTTSSGFKDGTYTAQGDYTIHLGPKHIGVTITLKDDVITSAEVTNGADDPTSKGYQEQFIAGFKPQVIGKKISDVNVTKVSGSSLTPQGFNDALTKIEVQAR